MNEMKKVSEPKGRDVFAGDMGYPRNQWYVAAFGDEIGVDTLLARKLLDTPVVLYRNRTGKVIALRDHCPHRGMPLSMGKHLGDVIQCGYHGMEFGEGGQCARIPQQDAVPAAMRTDGYAVAEKDIFVWIWMGDQDKADEALIPDHHWLGIGRPGYVATPFFSMTIKANFQFMHDNLMDTSHLTYLHPGMLDQGDMAVSDFWFENDGPRMAIGRDTPGVMFPEEIAAYFRIEVGKAYDRRLVSEAHFPSVSIGKQTIREAGDPDGVARELYAINALTPVSMRETHLFHVQVTSYPPEWQDADFTNIRFVVDQDRIALEAIQQRYEEYSDKSEVSIKSDKAGILGRRIMATLIDAEH